MKDKDEVGRIKEDTAYKKLLDGLPPELDDFGRHLAGLQYADTPDYDLLARCLRQITTRLGVQPADPFDWETGWEQSRSSSNRANSQPPRKSTTGVPTVAQMADVQQATGTNTTRDVPNIAAVNLDSKQNEISKSPGPPTQPLQWPPRPTCRRPRRWPSSRSTSGPSSCGRRWAR